MSYNFHAAPDSSSRTMLCTSENMPYRFTLRCTIFSKSKINFEYYPQVYRLDFVNEVKTVAPP